MRGWVIPQTDQSHSRPLAVSYRQEKILRTTFPESFVSFTPFQKLLESPNLGAG